MTFVTELFLVDIKKNVKRQNSFMKQMAVSNNVSMCVQLL